jgi:hypothetical protein
LPACMRRMLISAVDRSALACRLIALRSVGLSMGGRPDLGRSSKRGIEPSAGVHQRFTASFPIRICFIIFERVCPFEPRKKISRRWSTDSRKRVFPCCRRLAVMFKYLVIQDAGRESSDPRAFSCIDCTSIGHSCESYRSCNLLHGRPDSRHITPFYWCILR